LKVWNIWQQLKNFSGLALFTTEAQSTRSFTELLCFKYLIAKTICSALTEPQLEMLFSSVFISVLSSSVVIFQKKIEEHQSIRFLAVDHIFFYNFQTSYLCSFKTEL